MTDYEKGGAQHIERTASEDSNDAHIAEFTPEEQKKIIHRIDRRLVTTLGVLYMCSLMDRTNLGAANIAGMAKGLNLIGERYSLIVLIFFIPYVLFQPPATVVLRKVGPRRFLSAITLLWGGCMIGFGFVKKWDQMLGLRVILGVLEAGFFPGCAYLLSTWYTRFELQKRNAVFYLIGSMASAIAGIMAYGIMQMDGLGGLSGWRWIFVVEGLITCVFAILGYFLIVDFPEKAASSWRFLTPRESAFIVARIEKDRHDAIPEPFNITSYLKNALDSKVWAFASLFGLTTTNTYAIAYFLPVILHEGMGFSIAKAQCLVAPPYVAAAIVMYGCAVLGDKYHIRGPIVAFNAVLGLIGLPLLGYAHNNAVRYFGVFLATIAGNANVPAVLTYQANNIRGQWKRALCSATLVGFGGIGGIVGSTVFRDQDAPKYGPGIMTVMIANGLILVITALLSVKFHLANKRVDRGGKPIEGQEGFHYTL
ncbi:probable permease of the major facilitator superfamily [Phialocephala subalpina]|uniref:Probable permease of the major facilitator superfamily n=1 Tax=Phialocephala subalpina TaxID=576137 RepID=A0A1L7XHL8_9HELO|nr:probable permease of the major facilitator superfamily [Phialocephala subalpina]